MSGNETQHNYINENKTYDVCTKLKQFSNCRIIKTIQIIHIVDTRDTSGANLKFKNVSNKKSVYLYIKIENNK